MPEERYHLDKYYRESVFWKIKCLKDRPDPRDIAVVVRAPYIYDCIEAPVELLLVVGDVRGEVCILAVLLFYDPVLVIPEPRGTEPGCPVLFIYQPL